MLAVYSTGSVVYSIINWIVYAIAYYFVLKKIGLRRWACVLPILAEWQLSKVLLRRMRSFYRPFVVAAVLLIFALYLGPDQALGRVYLVIALIVWGIFIIRLYWRLAKAMGRGKLFAIFLIIFPPLFLLIMGLGKRGYQPLQLKPVKDHGRFGNGLRRVVLVMVSVVEIAVLVLGAGLLTVKTLPPEIMVEFMTSDFHKKTDKIVSDGQVISREDAMGDAVAKVSDMKPSREKFFPDHSQDESVVALTYIVGSNLEGSFGLASANVDQMIDATKQGDGLTFVVEAGGAKRWFTKGMEDGSYGRYEISGGKLTKKQDLPEDTCMADEKSLSDFLKWAKKNYKADRYMLVLWDHGGGVAMGYGADDVNLRSKDDGEIMQTSEVIDAISKAGIRFDVVGFDACLMQDLEIAAALEPYTDYYLASEETEGGSGWFYTDPFGKMAENPGMSSEDFAVAALSCYDQLNTIVKDEDGEPDTKATLSFVDTAMAAPAYDEFTKMLENVDAAVREDPDAFASVAVAGTNAYNFTDKMQIDLIDFLTILGKTDLENRICSDEEMEDLVHRIQACVLYRNKNAAEGIQGVAFAFPYQNMAYYTDTYEQLKKMSMTQEQSTFDVIFSIMAAQKKNAMKDPDYQSNALNEAMNSGGGLSQLIQAVTPVDYTDQDWYVKGFEDYDTSEALVDIPLKETEEGYRIEVPEKTWNIITDCQTMVYREAGKDGQQVYLGRDHIGSEDAEGHPLIATDGYWVSIGGQTVCYEAEPVRETKEGDVYSGLVRARLNDKEDIILHVEWDPQSDPDVPTEGHVTGYEKEGSDLLSGLLDTKGTLNLKAGDTIQFIFDTYDKEGNLVKSAPSGEKIRVSKQSRLKVEDQPLEGRLFIGGVLTDMYQRTMTTEMVELSEPAENANGEQ